MESIVSNKEYIQHSHLSLCIRDKTGDIGQSVMSLKDACGENPYRFKETLLNRGVPIGVITGNVRVVWPQSEKNNQPQGILKKGFLHF